MMRESSLCPSATESQDRWEPGVGEKGEWASEQFIEREYPE